MAKNHKKNKKKKSKKDSYGSGYYNQGYSGFVNPSSGAGTDLDKNSTSFYAPTRITAKNFIETLSVESWAAAKFINIPVDDMFIRSREFFDMDNEAIKIIEKSEKKFDINGKLSKSMKASTMYGTGLFIIMTKEAPPDRPFDISRMLPGDLANIITVDRYDATIVSKTNNPLSLNYGKPEVYRIQLKMGGSFNVHYTRVIRFDGVVSTSDNSWESYDPDWGVASIVPVICEILQSSNVSKGIAQLVNESSIPVQKVEGLTDILGSEGADNEMSLNDRMSQVTALRSIYRTVFMDNEDSFERHDVTFSGLPEVMDRNDRRLAAAAGIPYSRFMETSALGMNATGDGDFKNYAVGIASKQVNQLTQPYDKIDRVLEKNAGINEKIKYRFPSLIDMSDQEKADILLKKSQALAPLLLNAVITEDEARSALDGDDILGNLDDLNESIFRESIAEDYKNDLKNITPVQNDDSKKSWLPWRRKK